MHSAPDLWSYLSPTGGSSSKYKEKGSLFLGFLAPAKTPEEAMDFLAGLRKKRHDATHHCWAYRTGWREELTVRCGDDGEPGRTAGPPILASLKKRGVSDACLVVVRYFGGVKLGTGGLARAYRATATLTLEEARLKTSIPGAEWSITLPYEAQGVLRHKLEAINVTVEDAGYGESLTLIARVPKRNEARFVSSLAALKESWKGAVSWKSK